MTLTLIAGKWKMHGLQAQLAEIAAMARSVRETSGDLDAAMLREAGATSVILGHAERRQARQRAHEPRHHPMSMAC
jgi:triosephosphate isomerase